MTDRRSSKLRLGAGSLTAAVALLAGLSQANAQAPAPGAALSGAGSFPQSFIVPGTSTSLHVGGFLQMDVDYDMSAHGTSGSLGALDNLAPMSTELQGNGIAATLPAHTDHGTLRFSPQNSRFLVETRTPTSYGELKTFIEMDFAGSMSIQAAGGGGGTAGFGNTAGGSTQTNFNSQSMVRMKQAYGTLGPWLFGQTNSNYADLAALADTLDAFVEAGISIGAGNVKTPQVRYTYLLPGGMSVSGSIEENNSGGYVASSTGAGFFGLNSFNAPGFVQKYPAFTATGQIQQPWGHAGVHFAVGETRLKNPGGALGASAALPGMGVGDHIARWGYQASFTGHFNTIGKDKITWNVHYGQGASMYAWGLNNLGVQTIEGLVCSGNAATVAASTSITCSQPRDFGVNAGYSHWWTDTWRSGVAVGYGMVTRPNATATWSATTVNGGLTGLERKHYNATGNIIWTPIAGVQFGLEYEWYHRVVWSGASGSANRIHAQTLFAF